MVLLNKVKTWLLSMDYRCTICLDVKGHETRAKPSACDHSFCLDCLKKWSKHDNSCPLDFKKFNSIIVIHNGQRIKVATRKKKKKEPLYDFTSLCEVCHIDESSYSKSELILCDSCDLGYHMECLTPPLTNIPDGTWDCPTCQEVVRRKKKKNFMTKEGAKNRRGRPPKNERKAFQSNNTDIQEIGTFSGVGSYQPVTSRTVVVEAVINKKQEDEQAAGTFSGIGLYQPITSRIIDEEAVNNKSQEVNNKSQKIRNEEKKNSIKKKEQSIVKNATQTDNKIFGEDSRQQKVFARLEYHNPFCKCCNKNYRWSILRRVKIQPDGSLVVQP